MLSPGRESTLARAGNGWDLLLSAEFPGVLLSVPCMLSDSPPWALHGEPQCPAWSWDFPLEALGDNSHQSVSIGDAFVQIRGL